MFEKNFNLKISCIFYIILPLNRSHVALKFLKLKCGSRAVASRSSANRALYAYTHPFWNEGVDVAEPGGAGGEKREDNLLCCQYVAHNDRLLDFSDTTIIIAADLDRSSLA